VGVQQVILLVMSLPTHPAQLALFGVEHLLGDAFAASDPYRLFAQRIYPLLLQARATLEQCYCQDNGRPGCEPVLLLGITLLQFMEKLPDRAAMAMLKYHLGWKLALHQELELAAPDPSTLVYFRRRLLQQEQGKLLFDTILTALIEQGLVSKRGKRRLDSTQVLGLLADLSEAEKLCATMRLALEYLQGQGMPVPEDFARWVERYVQSRPDWRMEKEAARGYCQRLGQDLQRLRSWLQQEHPAWLQERPLQLLERVYQESFAEQDGVAIPKPKLAPGALVNPHEAEAVLSRKGQQYWTGYKVQISESVPAQKAQAGEPTGAFITAVHTQVASDADIKSLEAIREAEQQSGLEAPAQRYVDSAYVSGEQLRKEQQAGGELMGPIGRSKQHPAEAQGFVIASDGRSATCPAGHPNEHCRACNKSDRQTQGSRLVWARCCQSCPRRGQCLRAGASERHVETRIDFALLQQRRAEQKTEAFQEQMRQRHGIEGSLSELVRGHGLRRTRYRGQKKVHLGHLLIGAACNAKRWLKRLQYELRQQLRAVAEADRTGSCAMAG
jgi:transposase